MLLEEMMITVNVLVRKARNATVRDDVDLLLAAIRPSIQTYTVRNIDHDLCLFYKGITVSVSVRMSLLFTLYAHPHSLRHILGTQGVPPSSGFLQLHVKFQPSPPDMQKRCTCP